MIILKSHLEMIRQKRIALEKKDGNEWHPMHHENKETFETEDLMKLAKKHAHMLTSLEKDRKREFKVIYLCEPRSVL